ncbi:helix-turn-helix transcriptional regulator [Streptomyces sp. JV176]|uniref:helix-turn-helix transcriptional regulator n=1 Tax=Streptomyces sp. JV176 TaxID=858630 RepID=UPI002E798A19|nr:helix-turn-helix transcriptional regulator [Streptomyces sp. JV176]MEE1803270.1 helix-turn-helix transcriptional regulator [Streptomyces sp. JV176]
MTEVRRAFVTTNRHDPGEHLARLGAALRHGRDPWTVLCLAERLIRAGHGPRTLAVLEEWETTGPGTPGGTPADTPARDDLHAVRTLMRCDHPGIDGAPAAPAPGAWEEVRAARPAVAATAALAGALAGLPAYEIAPRAEHALAAMELGRRSAPSALLAIRALLHADRLAPAATWSLRLAREADRGNAPAWQAEFLVLLAVAEYRQGQLPSARAHITSALAAAPAGEHRPWRRSALLMRRGIDALTAGAGAGTATGDATGAGADDGAGSDDGSGDGDVYEGAPPPTSLLWADQLALRGQSRLSQGRNSAALADFLRCGRALRAWDIDRPTVIRWRSGAARAHAAHAAHAARKGSDGRDGSDGREGRGPERALALALEEVRLARACAAPRALGISLRRAASVADAPFRLDLLQESARSHEIAGARLEWARTRFATGTELLAAQDRGAARQALDEAFLAARECRATALAERIRATLGAAGCQDPGGGAPSQGPPAAGPPHPLTASQRRVARLAAAGRSNRLIAEELSLTVGTVEQHLTRIYRKLGIRNRAELTRLPAMISWP